jgi:LmbE family N-acetylglucosaminyl deacetylase
MLKMTLNPMSVLANGHIVARGSRAEIRMQSLSSPPSVLPTALFLFAHQDDEFGVFQKIIDARRHGLRVMCAYMTDGAVDGCSPLRRNLESLAVLSRMGVQEEDIYFAGQMLSIPDGGLSDHLDIATDWIVNWLIRYPLVSAIYLPAWEGGHHDHDALHAIGVIAAEESNLVAAVRQFPLYNGYKCRGPLFRVLLPLAMNGEIEVIRMPWANRLRFLRYCLSYPSQMITWLGLLPFVLLHYIFFGTQVLQTVSKDRIYFRPHDGPLYYERRQFFTWEKMSYRLSNYIAKRRKF